MDKAQRYRQEQSEMTVRRLLQQFARYPEPGKVKTRLQTQLSAEESCAVHESLLLRTARTLVQAELGDQELWLDRAGEHSTLSSALGMGMAGPYLQRGGDLGERMYASLHEGLGRAEAVVLVGSDCPVLSRDYLLAAFQSLERADVVLGPAEDGGFVLIGCTSVHEDMFAGVSWGGDEVLETTRANFERLGLADAYLATLYDVDSPDDLRRWRREQS
ncbi:TIGR04282 family arsenosugar biosynthesis glycosyltransferase [Congregibacter brevis]|uniref:TIGR04282 family arsenosugar biosynthesis glycosyltransferase n=1 Tax=Congregibacter brevis TaxID=3081201 RepID=A0ABZ0IA38_9GAMM|nr:TIGR04282 family arsenosugar biosynthesis glycosyltransferase [Congregibacter sp. IMCC45268]